MCVCVCVSNSNYFPDQWSGQLGVFCRIVLNTASAGDFKKLNVRKCFATLSILTWASLSILKPVMRPGFTKTATHLVKQTAVKILRSIPSNSLKLDFSFFVSKLMSLNLIRLHHTRLIYLTLLSAPAVLPRRWRWSLNGSTQHLRHWQPTRFSWKARP